MIDSSCYLSSPPFFRNIQDNRPAIGINNVLNTKTIPAKVEFLAGKYTDMPAINATTNLNKLKTTTISLNSMAFILSTCQLKRKSADDNDYKVIPVYRFNLSAFRIWKI